MTTDFKVPNYTLSDYVKFFNAGAICCTLSHGGMTPIDVVKTRIQIDNNLKGHSLLGGARKIITTEGPKSLLAGASSTFAGYFFQGGLKFGGYEYFKRQSVLLAGSQKTAVENRTFIYLSSAALAEVIADVALCPLEATRIRLVSNKNFASGMFPGLMKLFKEGGFKTLYAGFVPIVAKQVPYSCGQFYFNEISHEVVNRVLGKEKRKAIAQNQTYELGITLGCGLSAGVAAAILSHPGDTLLSQINKGEGDKTKSASRQLVALAKQIGPKNIWAGLVPRIYMTMGLVSSQFVAFKAIKEALGASEGIEIHAA